MFWMRKSQLVLFEILCQHQWVEHNQRSSCYHSDLKQTCNLALRANWGGGGVGRGAIALVLPSFFFQDQAFIGAHDFTYRLRVYPLCCFGVMLNLFHNPSIKNVDLSEVEREVPCPPPSSFLTFVFKINPQVCKPLKRCDWSLKIPRSFSSDVWFPLQRVAECRYY